MSAKWIRIYLVCSSFETWDWFCSFCFWQFLHFICHQGGVLLSHTGEDLRTSKKTILSFSTDFPELKHTLVFLTDKRGGKLAIDSTTIFMHLFQRQGNHNRNEGCHPDPDNDHTRDLSGQKRQRGTWHTGCANWNSWIVFAAFWPKSLNILKFCHDAISVCVYTTLRCNAAIVENNIKCVAARLVCVSSPEGSGLYRTPAVELIPNIKTLRVSILLSPLWCHLPGFWSCS